MHRWIVTILLWLLLAYALTNVYPVPQSATISEGASSTYVPAAGAHTASGGNISALILSVNTQTQRWQGYYGKIFGNITLEGGGYQVYEWEIGFPTGEIYVTRNTATPAWTLLDQFDISASDLDRLMNYSNTSQDSATNTFTSDASSAMTVAAQNIPANSRDRVMTFNASEVGVFEQILLVDANVTGANISNVVYAGILRQNETDFRGGKSDFQLLVPEDNTNNTDSTAYLFYVELG